MMENIFLSWYPVVLNDLLWRVSVVITKSMNSDEKNIGLETEIWVTVPVFSLRDHEQTLPSLSLNFSSCYRVDFFEAQTYIQLCVYIVCT